MFLPSNITLSPGDSGDYVAELQRRLAQRNLLAETNITAYYDGITTNAVKSFQALSGLHVDGIAGPETIRRLNSFASNADGESIADDQNETQEEKTREHATVRDDMLITEQAYQLDKARDESLRDAAAHRKEDTTIDELRSRGDEALGTGREQSAMWKQDGMTKAADANKAVDLEAQKAALRDTQHDIANLEKTQQAQNQDQLKFTQEGVQAKTLNDSLKEDPNKPREGEGKSAEELKSQTRDQAELIKVQQQRDAPAADTLPGGQLQQAARDGQQRDVPGQGAAAGVAVARDGNRISPDARRTEGQLDGPSRGESRHEGKHLHERGVRDNGTVPERQLGNLSPAQTPVVGNQQQVGLGA